MWSTKLNMNIIAVSIWLRKLNTERDNLGPKLIYTFNYLLLLISCGWLQQHSSSSCVTSATFHLILKIYDMKTSSANKLISVYKFNRIFHLMSFLITTVTYGNSVLIFARGNSSPENFPKEQKDWMSNVAFVHPITIGTQASILCYGYTINCRVG